MANKLRRFRVPEQWLDIAAAALAPVFVVIAVFCFIVNRATRG